MPVDRSSTRPWIPYPLEASKLSVRRLPLPELVPKYNPGSELDIPPWKKYLENKKKDVSRNANFEYPITSGLL